jgi:hypothetical protein
LDFGFGREPLPFILLRHLTILFSQLLIMVCSTEESKIIRPPLGDRWRELVEPGFLEFYDAECQKEDSDIRTDPASRAAPSKYATTSSQPLKPLRVQDVDVGNFSVRVCWPDEAPSENKQKGCALYWPGGNY